MFSALILATILSPSTVALDQLAFVARFYKPGKERSHFAVYVSATDGTNRRMLAMPTEPNQVAWIGKNKLAVSTDKGIYISPLKAWRPRLIMGSQGMEFMNSRYRTHAPGDPELAEDYESIHQHINPVTNTIEAFLESAPDQSLPEKPPSEDSDDSESAIEIMDPNGNPLKLISHETFIYMSKGKRVETELDFIRAWVSPLRGQLEPERLWLQVGSHTSTSGDINGLLMIEKDREPRYIFENANVFDFWGPRSAFAYCTPRDTSPLGKIQVWSSELHVGDWKRGTDVTLFKGAVHVASVSIRP